MSEFTEKLRKLNQPVKAEDIDFRVQSVTTSGYAVILAYKDARYDMKMLDDVVGPDNWARDHKIIDGNLYCGIGIRRPAELDPDSGMITTTSQWVWKWDVGVESNTEKEKGQASDSFKRAGFNWGIGRELYDFPFICIKLTSEEFTVVNGKAKTTNKFKLKDYEWNIKREKGKIVSLTASYKGEVRYSFTKKLTTDVPEKKQEEKADSEKSGIPEGVAPELAAAIAKLNTCKTIKTLEKLWADHPHYHNTPEFKNCARLVKAAIKGKPTGGVKK